MRETHTECGRAGIADSCQINITVRGLCYKKQYIIDSSILSTRDFHLSQNVGIMQLRKNRQ